MKRYVRIIRGFYEGYIGEICEPMTLMGKYKIRLIIDNYGTDIRHHLDSTYAHYDDIRVLSEQEYRERLLASTRGIIFNRPAFERQIFERPILETTPLLTREEIRAMFEHKEWKVEKIIFNAPATIVIWKDGTKTISKCGPLDKYDPEKGVAICFMKKMLELDPNKKDRKTTASREAFNILQKAQKQYKKQRNAEIEEMFAE